LSRLWRQSWFLLALLAVLAAGLAAGLGARRAADAFVGAVSPSVTTAVVVFLMAYSLDSRRLRESLRRPSAAVLGSTVNLGVLPALAAAGAPLLAPPDLALGLVVTAISPSTLATASVFTRRAGGNDAISLLVTLLTNVACVAVTPLWLRALVSEHAEVRTAEVVRQLALCVLLPTLVGQLCLLPRAGRATADRHRARIELVSQLLVLLVVSTAAVRAGLELRRHEAWPSAGDLVAMAVLCLAVHAAGLAGGWWGGGVLRLAPADRIATAIAGSQKTLPVSLLIAASPSVASADAPFVIFPPLAYHAIQLVLDTAIVDAWRRPRPSARSRAGP
jgi:sodium/bile acid cotransporter 7